MGKKVFYLCDRRACERCHPECSHTADIRHAANFSVLADGSIWEDDNTPMAELFADDIGAGRRTILPDQIADGTYSG